MTTTTAASIRELTTLQAARYLGVTHGHMRHLIATGKVAAHKRAGGRDNYVWQSDLDRYNDDPQNRQPGVKGYDRTPRRYGLRWRPTVPTPPTPLPDPVGDDVRALIAAYGRGERDLEATTQAVLARVREA